MFIAQHDLLPELAPVFFPGFRSCALLVLYSGCRAESRLSLSVF